VEDSQRYPKCYEKDAETQEGRSLKPSLRVLCGHMFIASRTTTEKNDRASFVSYNRRSVKVEDKDVY
jgi:hypothetical protein